MPSPPDDNLSQDIVTPVGLGDAIVHHGRDVLLLLESNGTIKRVGGSSIQDVGLTADRAVGQKLSSFLHPGDQVLLTGEDVFEALARFDLHHVELRFDLGNGLFQLTAGTITDLRDNADFSGIALSLRSIGKPARQVPNRQLLLQAVEAANSSIVIAQAGQDDLPLVYANEGFRSVTGYDEDEIIGRNCRFLQCRADDANRRDVENTGEFADDEVDQAEALEELRRGIESREFVNVTLRNYRKNGELFYNDLYLTPVSMGGVFAGFIGVQNDVTQRVEAERELRQRGRLLNGFFDSAPLLMAVVQVGASESDIGRYDEGEFDQRRQAARDLYEHDVNSDAGKVARLTSHVELNQAALDHYGVERDEAMRMSLDQFGFNDSAQRDWAAALNRVARTGEPQRFEATCDGDGRVTRLSITVAPIVDGTTPRGSFCYVAQDVTHQRGLERQVIDAQERERERIARDLHDTVAQQLNMVTLLVGNTRRQLASTDVGDAVIEQLDDAVQQATAAARQARDLSHNLGGIEVRERGLVSALGALADRVERSFGCRVVVDADASCEPESEERRVQLYRIASEAVANAARHGKPDSIVLGLRLDDSFTGVLSIEDDGRGLPSGFDAAGRAGSDGDAGMGVQSMRHRSALIDGHFAIRHREVGGTIVAVEFPIR